MIVTYAMLNPGYAFGIVLAVLLLVGHILAMCVQGVFRLGNRVLRSVNIRKHGWPPPHCDADGDAIDENVSDFDEVSERS